VSTGGCRADAEEKEAMKVHIDGELCSGHGRCYANAMNVFRLDDNGYNADRGSTIDVPPGIESAAVFGLRSCPEAAISIVED
jgi:ferredoxin